jgi:O-antigen ligase
LDVDVEACIFVATLVVGITRAVFLALADIGLFGGNIIRTPAVSPLCDGKRIGTLTLAVLGALAVGLEIVGI